MKISRQKGTKDIFGEDIKIWQYIEEKIREICLVYNIEEIRTPVFEATELYARGVGDDTDVVNKEMYTFLDKGGRSITLRPELTAGVVRAYIENGMSSMSSPVKLWYEANMYRYEKMQKGRYREFAQFGVEFFGSKSYLADIECIMLAYELFEKLGLKDDILLTINSIGCVDCRRKYIEALKDFVRPNLDGMCDTCKTRFEKNPLRILDCKEEKCQRILKDAPMITDYLCEECNKDFENLKSTLNDLGVKYEIDKKIVRGLDYYNKTVFEFVSKDLGLTVCGGGRYDKLIETLDGPATPAVGFGLGMDRLVIVLKEIEQRKQKENGYKNIFEENVDIFFAVLDNKNYAYARKVITALRDRGLKVEIDINDRSFNGKMKYANKINANYVCIIGEDEKAQNKCLIKNMRTGEQKSINFNEVEIIMAL